MRYWRIAALFSLGLVAAACGDEDSPTEFNEAGNLHGTWVLEDEEGVTFVRVTSTGIRVYEEADTCFRRRDYTIEGVDGTLFSVVQDDTLHGEWELSVENDVLVMDNGVESVQLVPTDVDVNDLQLCAAVVLFGNLHPSCEELPAVPVPGTLTGTLGDGDKTWAGSWYDAYSLQLSSPATVTVLMTSPDEELDTYLVLFPPTGGAGSADSIAGNDDINYAGGNYNSRMVATLERGCYVIVANSYDEVGDAGGEYVLDVTADVPQEPEPEPEPQEFPPSSCVDLPQVTLDASVMGRLEDSDPHWASDGSYYDMYGLQIETATAVTIEHRAGADDNIDPYLFLFNEDGSEELATDDDDAGDTDSQIATTLDPGCYVIVAGSWSTTPDEEGTYMVSVSTGTVEPELEHEACVNLPVLVDGDVVNGTLVDGDMTWGGTWIDLYSLQITESTDVRLTLTDDGGGIDTWLGIYDFQSGSRIVDNDDIDYDGGDYNSQLETTLAPGCYVVYANSYSPDENDADGGPYELTMEEL